MESLMSTFAGSLLWSLRGRRTMVCAACGHQLARLPHAEGRQLCPACGSLLLVPSDSPIGRGMLLKHAKH